MQIVIEYAGAEREVDVVIDDPRACVAELVEAVDPVAAAVGAGVRVGDRFFGPDAGLDEAGLQQGATVRICTAPPAQPGQPGQTATAAPAAEADGPDRAPGAAPLLAVVAGPAAGDLLRLDAGPVTIGRDRTCSAALDDPSLSRRHAQIRHDSGGELTVIDFDSLNGTWVDGQPVLGQARAAPGALLRLGATHVRVLPAAPDDRPAAAGSPGAVGGLSPFNRPPRGALPPPLEPIVAPETPEAAQRRRALSAAAIVAPLLMGAVLVVLYGNPRFALFMLLSPVIAVGNWLSDRRRSKAEHRESSREQRQALAAFDAGLARLAAAEIARREELLADPAEVARRALAPSTRLWERRPAHQDFLRLHGGLGAVPWTPPVSAGREGLGDDAAGVLAARGLLAQAPAEIDLSAGGVVGLVGNRSAALGLARSLLCQAAVHHGPADLEIAVLAPGRAGEWDWTKWLPHARAADGQQRMVAGERRAADALLAGWIEAAPADRPGALLAAGDDRAVSGRTRLYLLDGSALTEGRRAPARLLLAGTAGPATGIVIAETEDQLPAVCTSVVDLRSDLGDAQLRRPQARERVDALIAGALTESTARRIARALARYEDPELEIVGAGLPQQVRLLPLLGEDALDAPAVRRAWDGGHEDPPLRTPIGVSEAGVVQLDLVRDGPHGLIAGTTGSGKSELLRSLIAGLAAGVDPEHLVFVLVDYKGGSAFDQCARLPHTVGMVTDLDGHLGERALASLEAELHHRERLLREAGAAELPEYLRAGAPLGPLPRLMVVIDEFATLAAELPDFLGALVGVAQRGRSLGVHLILATQRPAGAVNANIKANTNLRIALRVQDASDSIDVIDCADAASIGRSTPGRAYVRLGPGDLELVQTPLSTAAAGRRLAPVRLAPFPFAPVLPGEGGGDSASGEAATDLERLVEAVRTAFDESGIASPRRPWLEMLPERVDLDEILARAGEADPGVVPFALADDPAAQRRVPVGWKPADGHIALYGMVGSGTTTTLVALAVALAESASADDTHIHAIDFGPGGLAALADLPHVGSVIAAREREAQSRLLRHLRAEVDRRRALDPVRLAGEPRLVVLIDGIGAFLAEHEDPDNADLAEAFRRVFADGAAVGVVFALTADRVGELPVRLSSLVAQKLLFRLADPQDFSAVGLRPGQLPAFVPGRAIHGESGLVAQVADPGDVPARAARLAQQPASRPPSPIRTLPDEVDAAALEPARLDGPAVSVPLGIADADLGPAILALHPGAHALVAGPPRSGKSSVLQLIAQQVRAASADTVLIGICSERSPLFGLQALDAAGGLEDLGEVVRAAPAHARRWLIFVDDAPMVDDVDDVLATALRCGRPDLHVIAAGRIDDVRAGFAHWSRAARQSRTGILLQPDLAADGDVLGVRLPRRTATPLQPGRGFVISDGELALAQLAALQHHAVS